MDTVDLFVSPTIARSDSLSVERMATQYNPRSRELLADPTGQKPLLIVYRQNGWSAIDNKREIPDSALIEFDEVGLAVQLLGGDSNGFLTPYRDVFLVPAGMRVRIDRDGPQFIRDDLRDFLLANRFRAETWNYHLLLSPEVDGSNGRLLLSGGLDSVAVLLSYHHAQRPITAAHVQCPSLLHEAEFAHRVAEGRTSVFERHRFKPIEPEELFDRLDASPFGRKANFVFYRRVLEQSERRKYVLNGEMNGLDVGFTDHSDRFRSLRRTFYKNLQLRKFWQFASRLSPGILSAGTPRSKIDTLLQSLRHARSPHLYLIGAALGFKGFPGLAGAPYLRAPVEFVRAVEQRFRTFFPSLDLSSDSFDVDFYLFNYRWILGKSNCSGFQEAGEIYDYETRFPFNSPEAILWQISMRPDLVKDKAVLKNYFSSLYPEVKDIICFRKDLSLGNKPNVDFVKSSAWSKATMAALDSLPETQFVDPVSLAREVMERRPGSFAGTGSDIPTDWQMNLSTMVMRRAQAQGLTISPRKDKLG